MTQVSNVIFLFGAPCSGKSALRRALQKDLGSEWTSIDERALTVKNKCNEFIADQAIDRRIESLKHKIIIEAKIPWRSKQEGEFYFMLLPPLDTLMIRNVQRAAKSPYSLTQALATREMTVLTHDILSRIDKEYVDHVFDSSQMSIQEELDVIKAAIKPKTHIRYFKITVVSVAFSIACALFIHHSIQ